MLKSYLEVNLKNIENNIIKIKNEVGERVTVAPVIKADAYGLGATKLKKLLERLSKFRYLFYNNRCGT